MSKLTSESKTAGLLPTAGLLTTLEDTLATTPNPPYYAVIFTSTRTDIDNGYEATADRMIELAKAQEGFLVVESARANVGVCLGITVSYWQDLQSIKLWKQNLEHLQAQQQGKEKWYLAYKIRIAKVERDYGFITL